VRLGFCVAKRKILVWVAIAAVVAVAAIGYFLTKTNEPVTVPSSPDLTVATPTTPDDAPKYSEKQRVAPEAATEPPATETVTPTQDSTLDPVAPAVSPTSQKLSTRPRPAPVPQSNSPTPPPERPPQSVVQIAPSVGQELPIAPTLTVPTQPKPAQAPPPPDPLPTRPKGRSAASEAKRSTQVTIPLPGRKSDR
jgi:hypothetical protein